MSAAFFAWVKRICIIVKQICSELICDLVSGYKCDADLLHRCANVKRPHHKLRYELKYND